MIDQFLDHQEHYVHVGADRLTQQRRLLEEFAEFLTGPINEATAVQFGDFLAAKSRDYAPNTVRFYRNLIRPYFWWGWQRGIVEGDTLMAIRSVKSPKGASGQLDPRPYSRAEITQLWVDLDHEFPSVTESRLDRWFNPNTPIRWSRVAPHFQHAQTQAIISLALQMGLRRNEIHRLTLDEMHYDNEFVVVTSKGKTREVPYSEAARLDVQTWIERRTLLTPGHDSPWLTLSPMVEKRYLLAPMSEYGFEHLLTGIGVGYELHRLRHTCATERLRANMPLEALRDLLGHSSLSQTLAYAKIVAKDVGAHLTRSQQGFDRAVGRRAA